MAAKTQPIIIIKRNGGHAGHHGGAWKVAYADFVTAMMALFIVLWLMNSSDKIKKAVAGYFNDPKGTGGLLGTQIGGIGPDVSPTAPPENLQKLKEKLEQEIKARKELQKLSKQIEITTTLEGLRIELIEDKNGTFYELGSPRLSANGQELLALLAGELNTLPNKLLIEGHTDATPYSSDTNYSNWELSADRANSARRLLQQDGVRSDQVTQVRGYADQFLRVKNNPLDPSNRRISILVKNDEGPVTTFSASDVVKGTATLPGAPPVPAKPGNGAKPQDIKPAAGQPGKQAVLPPAATPAPIPASVHGPAPPPKPAAGKPAAKPSLVDKLKGMLPWTKK